MLVLEALKSSLVTVALISVTIVSIVTLLVSILDTSKPFLFVNNNLSIAGPMPFVTLILLVDDISFNLTSEIFVILKFGMLAARRAACISSIVKSQWNVPSSKPSSLPIPVPWSAITNVWFRILSLILLSCSVAVTFGTEVSFSKIVLLPDPSSVPVVNVSPV